MDLLEISDKKTLRREQAAELLRQLADSLARHNDVEFTENGNQLRVRVPDQVTMEVELEIENDESSIEVEISW